MKTFLNIIILKRFYTISISNLNSPLSSKVLKLSQLKAKYKSRIADAGDYIHVVGLKIHVGEPQNNIYG
jgi:hypothetical protein